MLVCYSQYSRQFDFEKASNNFTDIIISFFHHNFDQRRIIWRRIIISHTQTHTHTRVNVKAYNKDKHAIVHLLYLVYLVDV